uniref:leucine--tRNA ligase n=1 Tax=Knipowitschia caucasica TaxID=637954 RepID=A0AAV2MEE7_KNICA
MRSLHTLYSSTQYSSTQYSSTLYSSTLYSSTQYSSTQYSSTQYSSTLYSSTLYSSTQYSSTQYSNTLYSSTQYSSTLYSSTQYSSTQYSSMLYSSTQYSTTHYSTISRLMGLSNALSASSPPLLSHSVEFEEALSALVLMTAPLAPHLCSELWAGLCALQNPLMPSLRAGHVLEQPWPTVDPEHLEEPDFVELTVLVDNHGCGRVMVPRAVSKDLDAVKRLVVNSEVGQKHLHQKTIKRAILSPRTALINILTHQ